MHLSYGEEDIAEYISQWSATIYTRLDLAVAPARSRPRLGAVGRGGAVVSQSRGDHALRWSDSRRPESATGGNPQADLLIGFGRNPNGHQRAERAIRLRMRRLIPSNWSTVVKR